MKNILFFISILFFSVVFAQPGTQVPKKIPEPKQTPAPKAKSINKPQNKSSNLITLIVSPETVPCSHNSSIQCLKVKKQDSIDFENLEDIEKFNYDLGYIYTIQVKEITKTPPIKINESVYRYVWIKTLSKKEVVSEVTTESNPTLTPTTPYQPTYQNGKVIGQTSIITSSDLDKKWYLRKMKETDGSSFVTDDNVMYIEINTFKDRIDGFGACNKFATVVRSNLNTTFEITKLTSNYAMCGNKKLEDLFYDLLQQVNRFEIKNGNLILSNQWNYLLAFTSNPDNKEDIITTYTPTTIVKNENKVYASNESIGIKPEDKYSPPFYESTNRETAEEVTTEATEVVVDSTIAVIDNNPCAPNVFNDEPLIKRWDFNILQENTDNNIKNSINATITGQIGKSDNGYFINLIISTSKNYNFKGIKGNSFYFLSNYKKSTEFIANNISNEATEVNIENKTTITTKLFCKINENELSQFRDFFTKNIIDGISINLADNFTINESIPANKAILMQDKFNCFSNSIK